MAFVLYHGLMESFKSILSPEFGFEYELLNTELSIQSLRVRHWGDSIGLNIDEPGVVPQENGTTIVQVLNTITYILKEIEEIRLKYQPKSGLKDDSKPKSRPEGATTLSSLRKRLNINRNQKSIFTISRWALRDARKFDDKVKKLKGLVDGLEDISRVTQAAIPEENPPPYEEASEGDQNQTANRASSIPLDILEQHAVMKRFLAALPASKDYYGSKVREKLTRLSEHQFKELGEDVYDEILRRQDWTASRYLAPIEDYHPKRNEARKRLSTLLPSRFGHFVTHVMFELECRVPNIKDHVVRIPMVVFPDPFLAIGTERRWESVPPPPLQYRAAYQSTLPSRRYEPFLPEGQVEIFKSFRVKIEHTTREILPDAVRKFNINAPWERYALYVIDGNHERCLGMEEKPLRIFKEMKKVGKNPHFMLRKICPVPLDEDFKDLPGGLL